ncbi:A disintegrin and metalloproteinase with thrombospondin motifs 20 [Nymphon striatum]|nr:A disintegrin and metalloproteinase with thrombospondin motifs 20 [Nymphon striatum]
MVMLRRERNKNSFTIHLYSVIRRSIEKALETLCVYNHVMGCVRPIISQGPNLYVIASNFKCILEGKMIEESQNILRLFNIFFVLTSIFPSKTLEELHMIDNLETLFPSPEETIFNGKSRQNRRDLLLTRHPSILSVVFLYFAVGTTALANIIIFCNHIFKQIFLLFKIYKMTCQTFKEVKLLEPGWLAGSSITKIVEMFSVSGDTVFMVMPTCQNEGHPMPDLPLCFGLAEVGKVCDHTKSCSVVEDSGLSTAFTIAHELGHVLNIPHDGEKVCDEFNNNSTISNIMAAVMGEESDPWSWSKCSRHFLTEFLDSDHGKCILDRPVSMMNKKQHLHLQYQPGELYNASKQCELLYTSGYKPCYDIIAELQGVEWLLLPGNQFVSKILIINDKSYNLHLNVAILVEEDERKVSGAKEENVLGKNYRALTPVNGDWGEWSAYSSCSRSCGGGIAQSERLCDSPKYECLVESKSFRDVQCEVFNGVNFDLKDIPAHPKWVPKFYTEVPKKDSCRLICSVNGTSMYHILKEKVTDGTPCRPDYYDICVNGICVKAGCDHILGSSAKGDMCNVCQGNNSTCRVVSGSFNASRYGYNLVKVIPAGAANLRVEQKGYQGLSKDDNYLVLRTDDGYILNGNFILQSFELKLFYGGVEIEYSGSNTTVEKISTRRRLKKDVFLEVLTVGHLYPPDITYQYTVPLEDDETYKWHVQEEWTECTKVCKGEKYRRVVCTRIFDRALVDDDHCDYQPKPDILASVCNLHCSLKWHIFGESECSSRCSVGIKQRTIKCVQEIDQGEKHPLHDRYCEELESKPEEFVECVGDCSEVFWKLEEWSECSKTCGGGVQSRVATCVDSNNKVLKDRECSSLSKQTVRHCNTRGCPKWDYANWSACSVSCGTGKRIRTMWCQQDNQVVSNAYCDASITPNTEEECILKECTMWDHGNWGPCSVTCGEGFTQRTVRCLSESGKELSPFYCDYFKRPKDTMECDLPGCVTTMTSTESSTSTSTSFYYNSTIFYPSTVITKKKASPPPSRSRIDDKYRIAQRISPIWKTGSWTECSRPCGEGVKERYVACHDEGTGKRLPDDMCDSSAKPTGHQKCRDKSCGNWRTGEWSKCTVSCGEGIQLRHVICVLIDSQVEVFDDQCDAADRPPTETLCSMANCQNVIDHPQLTSYPATYPTDWITDEWGPCSQSCGGGYKQRQVKCQDIHHKESEFCDSEKRPTGTIRCNVEACPTWTTAQWSECSATCGKGMRVREILCHSSIGQELSHHYCDQSTKLESTEGCHSTKACIEKIEYYWQKESWSKVSFALVNILGILTFRNVCI